MSEMALQLIRQAKAKGWKRLDLGNTGIVGEVPAEIWLLTELEELILSSEWWEWVDGDYTHQESKNSGPENKISAFPAHLILPSAQEDIPQQIAASAAAKTANPHPGLARLQKLVLTGTQVADIEPLAKIGNLQYLYLDRTQVADIQPLAYLSNLQDLDLDRTQVADIQPLANLSKLQYLNLASKELADIQPLANLSKLQFLNLSGTGVADIQPLAMLSNLQVLDLNGTEVADLQPLADLSNLHDLNLFGTLIADIQPLAKLSNLQHLDLGLTQVADIQPLCNLLKLQYLDLSGTNVEFLPEDIRNQGAQAIVQYLQQAKKEEEAQLSFTNWQLKLVVVGNSRAGKTSLIHSWMEGKVVSAEKSTLWLGYQPWKLGNATLHMFDFGGQDYFHDAHHLFFSGNAAYLVLWDARNDHIGRAEDVEGILQMHYPLAYWLDAIRFHTRRPAKRLEPPVRRKGRIGEGAEKWLHKDQEQPDSEKAVVDSRETDTIRALVVQTWTDKTGIQHPDVSQLKADFPWIYDFEAISLDPEAPRRVQSLQHKLMEMLSELPSLGQTFPATYAWIRDALPSYTGAPTCTREEFLAWANEQEEKGLEENRVKLHSRKGLLSTFENIDSRLEYLHNLGIILYYPEVQVLKDTVFMRPEEIRKAALKVLEGLREGNGEFDEAYIASCLGKKADTTQMLALMQQFKMAFQLPDIVTETKARWVAPLYLPEAAPAGISLLLQVFERPVRRIVYPHFIHKSVILELFQTYVQDLYAADPAASQPDYLIWREGMVVQVKGSKELVLLRFFLGAAATAQDAEKAAHIDVYSFGEADVKRRAKGVLATLARINRNWTTEEQVTVDGQRFVPLQALEDASAKKEAFLLHEGHALALEDYHDFVDFPFARVFVSYAEEDEEFARALERHLEPLRRRDKLLIWTKRAITPGQHRDSLVRQELAKADLVVLLMSVDFFANKDIWQEEFKASLERHALGQCALFPVLVRQCDWQSTAVEQLKLALENPVRDPLNDDAWTELVHKVKDFIQMRQRRRGRQ